MSLCCVAHTLCTGGRAVSQSVTKRKRSPNAAGGSVLCWRLLQPIRPSYVSAFDCAYAFLSLLRILPIPRSVRCTRTKYTPSSAFPSCSVCTDYTQQVRHAFLFTTYTSCCISTRRCSFFFINQTCSKQFPFGKLITVCSARAMIKFDDRQFRACIDGVFSATALAAQVSRPIAHPGT